MAIWRRTCTALLIFGVSCAKPPRLVDYDADADYLTEIFPAPLVVVGTISSDTLIHRPVPSHRTPDLLLQLRRVDVRVENVLKGNARKGSTTIYYFTWDTYTGGNRPLGAWTPGDRRIFWLREEAGVLRAACDGRDCTMPVYSGAHSRYQADQHRPLGYALADIWFTRGEDASDADFAKQVDWGYPSTVPEAYVTEKLEHLAATEGQLVRSSACKQLSYLRKPCGPPERGTPARREP